MFQAEVGRASGAVQDILIPRKVMADFICSSPCFRGLTSSGYIGSIWDWTWLADFILVGKIQLSSHIYIYIIIYIYG